MVSPPAGGNHSAACLGLPVAGLVRDSPQREASPVLFPRPGSPGGLRGCVSPSLGQPGCVRVSTLSSRRKGGGSSQRVPQSLHESGLPPPPTPLWPKKEWFTDLLLLLTQPPFALPWWDRLLLQPHFNCFRQGVHALNLHEWRLSSVSSESRTFREDLLLRCPAASEHPLPVSTRGSGCSSVVDVVEGVLLRSTPLFP